MSILGTSWELDVSSIADNSLVALIAALRPADPEGRQQDDMRLRTMSDRALQWRRAQRSIFPEAVLRESCWDIMLLCLTSELAGRCMCVKQIRCELEESQTSVLRRIGTLEQAGMVLRQRDELDGRRTIVRLTRHATIALSRFFDKIDASSE